MKLTSHLPIPCPDKMPRLVCRLTLWLVVLWLVLVAMLGWWMSQRAVAAWMQGLAASTEYESQTTARVMDRLFTQMRSVANMVASQGKVIDLATRYRTDPPGFAALTRQQRATQLASDPLVGTVGDFMNELASDLQYARIYMNNLSDDTVTASNWAEPDSIVGMIYTGRTYLVDALLHGNGHSFGIARLNKSLSYFVSSRIDGPGKEPLGSVTVKFDAPEMALYLSGRHLALIVNRQGRVTTASSPELMLRNVAALLPPDMLRASPDGEEPGEPVGLRSMANFGSAQRWEIDGKPHLLQRRHLTHTDYHLITLAPLDELVSMRRQHGLTALLVAAVGLILLLLASYTVGQMVLRRQEEQRAAQEAFALNADLNAALIEAKTKERQKIEVLSYIGHDLRAPLATISGYSDLLLSDAQPSQYQLISTIQRSVEYQMELIEELLEYGKAELRPLDIQPASTDLLGLLRNILDYSVALCQQKNNQFIFQPSGPAPRHINIDGKRLQQVLLNLISNAAKFTENGWVKLSLDVQLNENACALHFSVKDTGVGIDLNPDADIFSAFQHANAASGGSGLGLFIAQRIVSTMGEPLRVASTPGQGSTFSFEMTAPVLESSVFEWTAVVPQIAENALLPVMPDIDPQAMPQAPAWAELAELALHGQFTDIERWIEHHAQGPAAAPLAAHLGALLERFDFSAIHMQALKAQSNA